MLQVEQVLQGRKLIYEILTKHEGFPVDVAALAFHLELWSTYGLEIG